MNIKVPFSPEQASTSALGVDLLYLYLIAITIFFSALIYVLVFVFAVKYRRRSEDEIPKPIHGNNLLEIIWTIIPLLISMSIFVGGTYVFFKNYRAPHDAEEIFVVGKQWMWKIQHPQGRREINELHIPEGRPIRLKMTSEDVIHSFFIPAFRNKMDVIPGRYSTMWFQATKQGSYHLFCAEYCGTEHSKMIGTVHVLSEEAYQKWLESGSSDEVAVTASGAELFKTFRCDTCHSANSGALGPDLAGIFGSTVKLVDGRSVTADEKYIRESILKPHAKIVAGYAPLMPSFQGQLNEEQILQIISYLKGLQASETSSEVLPADVSEEQAAVLEAETVSAPV